MEDGRATKSYKMLFVLRWEGSSRELCRAGVQLCLGILCTINLKKGRAPVKTLGLLMKCFAPRSGEPLAALLPQGHRAVVSSGMLGIKGCLFAWVRFIPFFQVKIK